MLSMEEAAQGFAAIGSQTRLEVLLVLVSAGHAGLTVSEIQERAAPPTSPLAHHLRFLAAGRLIQPEKRGQAMVSRTALERIKALAGFLLRKCYADAEDPVQSHAINQAHL